MPALPSLVVRHVVHHRTVLALVAVGLVTRLPLLSISLDEVDSANFHNALTYGYNITWIRPQAPGYPVYVFMAWLLDVALNDPLLSLTTLSAVLGSLAVVPFYLLLREAVGERFALPGSLLFLANPLVWSFSEAALSDAPAMFFALLAAYLAYQGRRSNTAFLASCVVMSVAIGVRQPSAPLLVLLAFPVAYRFFVAKERSWRLPAVGASLFTLTSLAWFMPAVFMGAGGFAEYFEALSKQWSTAVRIYDFAHVDPPWLPNLLYRGERFFLGYFVTHAWTGGDDKTLVSLVLTAPWLFGFALFVMGFRWRDPVHVFVVLWLVSLAYPILAIHFLARYGLSQLPSFIIACMIGYRFLGADLLRHPKRLELVSLAGLGTVVVMYGMKYQPPVSTFESTSPATELYAGFFLVAGVSIVVIGRWLMLRGRDTGGQGSPSYTTAVAAVLAFLVVPYGAWGHSVAYPCPW